MKKSEENTNRYFYFLTTFSEEQPLKKINPFMKHHGVPLCTQDVMRNEMGWSDKTEEGYKYTGPEINLETAEQLRIAVRRRQNQYHKIRKEKRAHQAKLKAANEALQPAVEMIDWDKVRLTEEERQKWPHNHNVSIKDGEIVGSEFLPKGGPAITNPFKSIKEDEWTQKFLKDFQETNNPKKHQLALWEIEAEEESRKRKLVKKIVTTTTTEYFYK